MKLSLLLCLLAIAFGCKPNYNSLKKAEFAVPQDVLNYVGKNFPSWEIPDSSKYNSWWQFYDRGQAPSYISADFNDDAHSDYALLLTKQDSLKLVFLIGDSLKSFKHFEAPDFTQKLTAVNDIRFGLEVQPPAQIDCVVDGKPVSLILKSNAVALMQLEVRTKVYYWNKDRFEVFVAR